MRRPTGEGIGPWVEDSGNKQKAHCDAGGVLTEVLSVALSGDG